MVWPKTNELRQLPVKQAENSEVFPSESVAVAVISLAGHDGGSRYGDLSGLDLGWPAGGIRRCRGNVLEGC